MGNPNSTMFSSSDLDLVTFLILHDVRPDRRSEEEGRATLHYTRTAEVESLVIEYHNECSVCGIAFNEVGHARGEAKRALLDGDL